MFSDKALKEQEPLITGYVDKLISRLHEHTRSSGSATLDIVKWYNYTTFDILGDLAFGDSFGCLESDLLHVRTFLKVTTLLTLIAMDCQHIPLHQRRGLL
jgi:hypothetical protein